MPKATRLHLAHARHVSLAAVGEAVRDLLDDPHQAARLRYEIARFAWNPPPKFGLRIPDTFGRPAVPTEARNGAVR